MVDWKTVRESIGYTQARQSKDAGKWRSLAFGYHAAAKVLDEHKDQIPGDTRPFALNAALSIELILKSILARKNIGIPQGSDGHLMGLSGAMALQRFLTTEQPGMAPDIQRTVRY
jgi:hypothetical protein